jgi:hypothetical protein
MQAKHGLSLETWSAIHGVHTSLLKRMSAAGWDVSKRSEVLRWIKVNGRETTRYVSQPDARPTPASKLDPKERARARTRENPAVMKFVRRSETSAPSDPAPKPTTQPPKTPVDPLPTLRWLSDRKEWFENLSPEKRSEHSAAEWKKWLTEP